MCMYVSVLASVYTGTRAHTHARAHMHTTHTQVKQEAADMGNQKDIEYPPWLEGTWQVCVREAAVSLTVCVCLCVCGCLERLHFFQRVCVCVCVCV